MLEDRLKQIEEKYIEIGKKMSEPEVATDIKKVTELAKEYSKLEKTVLKYREYKNLLTQLEELKTMSKDDDPEIKEMAELELETTIKKINKLEEKLELMLIPKDPNDEKNVIVEIRGAAGGDEAKILAGDLFKMYSKFAEHQNWKLEVLNAEARETGGYSQIEFMISGDSVYSNMKYESGVHRVQRVPQTESSGRVHTSTATVVVCQKLKK